MTAAKPLTEKQPKFWKTKRAWLLVSLLLIVLPLAIGWYCTDRYVRSQLKAQLADLQLGTPIIGGISISTTGISASQIRFQSPETSAVWLSVDQLAIQHPLSELIAGADHYDAITLSGVKSVLPATDLIGGNSDCEVQLENLQLPADRIEVENAELVICQTGKSDLTIANVQASITNHSGAEISIDAAVEDFLGARWQADGKLIPDRNSLMVEIKSTPVKITTSDWSTWPLVPPSIGDVIQVDGHTQIAASVNLKQDNRLAFNIIAPTDQLKLYLPEYELPLQLTGGRVQVDDESIVYQDIQIQTDLGGELAINGTSSIDQWPIQTDFSGTARDVSVSTLRKVFPDIPAVVAARGSGAFSGNVAVHASHKTVVNLSAEVDAPVATYGNIASQNAHVKAQIQDLIFDENFQFASIEGAAQIDGQFSNQPLGQVFDTFELAGVRQQLGIDGGVTGDFELTLPWASIDQLETWQVAFTAAAPTAELADQTVQNVTARGNIDAGTFSLTSVHAATTVGSTSPDLAARVVWPISDNVTATGLVELAATNSDTGWICRAIENLITPAIDSNASTSTGGVLHAMAADNSLEKITGATTAEMQINIPPSTADKIDTWTATGAIKASSIRLDSTALQNLIGDIKLTKSQLRLDGFRATTPQGSLIDASARLDLTNTQDIEFRLDASQLDVPWIRSALDTFANHWPTVIDADVWSTGQSLARRTRGTLDLGLKVVGAGDAPQLDLTASAKNMSLDGVPLAQWQLSLSGRDQTITAKEMLVELDPQRRITGTGSWDLTKQSGRGSLQWQSIPIDTVIGLARQPVDNEQRPAAETFGGATSGQIQMNGNTSQGIVNLTGNVQLSDLNYGNVQLTSVGFDVASVGQRLVADNFSTGRRPLSMTAAASIDLNAPFEFELSGQLDDMSLSRVFAETSRLQTGPSVQITGTATGPFSLSGQLSPFDFRTRGRIEIVEPSVNLISIESVLADWDVVNDDWEQSKFLLSGFGGAVKVVDFSRRSERLEIQFDDFDARRLLALVGPTDLSGKLSGTATVNRWSQPVARSAVIKLTGASILVGAREFADFAAKASLVGDQLSYHVDGKLLNGKLTGDGSTKIPWNHIASLALPLDVNLNSATLADLYGGSHYFRTLRPLSGELSAQAKFLFPLAAQPTGEGRVTVFDAKWQNRVLTRRASVHFLLDEKQLLLNDLDVDLLRGSLVADVSLPRESSVAGRFRVEMRKLDVERFLEVLAGTRNEASGSMDARLEGRIGNTVSGQGYLGMDRASLHGVSGQSFRVPIQFEFSPTNQSGQVKLRQSRFRVFHGTVAGSAEFNFGSRLGLRSDLKFSKIDSGEMLSALTNYTGLDQGTLSGRLLLSGRDIRSVRDVQGRFNGDLTRSAAFQLPVLEQIGRFLSSGNIANRNFDSDEISLNLSRGKIEVEQLNFQNSIAQVAVTGNLFLDGRLNLDVAARVEQLNQPTLIDELLGSPLASFTGPASAFAARASEFLSNRVAFLHVGGNFNRPQVRVDSAEQLREETIRYFLRGSNLLPQGFSGLPTNQ